MYCGWYPPPMYDYPYVDGPVEIIASAQSVRTFCPPFSQACMWGGRFHGLKKCTIFLLEGYSPRSLRHEMAHCNGWPADHPGAIPGC